MAGKTAKAQIFAKQPQKQWVSLHTWQFAEPAPAGIRSYLSEACLNYESNVCFLALHLGTPDWHLLITLKSAEFASSCRGGGNSSSLRPAYPAGDADARPHLRAGMAATNRKLQARTGAHRAWCAER